MADEYRFPEERFVLVGKIGKAHGLSGEIRITSFSPDPATLLQYSEVVLVDGKGEMSPPLNIEHSRFQGKNVVFKLDRFDTRDRAEALLGMGVLVNKNDLSKTEEGEYYWYEFYSLPVHTAEGRFLGTVDSIFSNGAQDILVIKDGTHEYLVPILDGIIREHTGSGVVISPPPGLLEINSGSYE